MVPSERPEDFVHRVTRRIAALRQSRGMTQEQFAVLLGTATRNVRRIEAGQNLTLYTLARVAKVFGVRPDDLLSDETERRSVRYVSPAAGPVDAVAEDPAPRDKRRR